MKFKAWRAIFSDRVVSQCLTCYRTVCEFQTVVAYRGQRSVYCGYSGSDCRFITQENSIDKHVG
jgi:hypothetical protein